jgi:Tol biopolymer transport system component
VGPGATTVVAASEGRSATLAVTVAAAPTARIALPSTAMDVEVGELTQLAVALRDARDQPTQRPVTWTTSDSSIATVSVAGLVTALRLGAVVLTATSDGQSASAAVRVGEAPAFDLVFNRRRSAADAWELLRLPLGTATPADAVRLATSGTSDRSAPSPDGSRLAVTERLYDLTTGEPRRGLAIRDRSGAFVRLLETRAGLEAWDPVWSRDGSRLAFTCAPVHGAARRICLIGADGRGFTELPAAGATTEESPSWSPDGTRLAYAAIDASGSAIWTMRADGTDRRRITTLGGQNARPAWMPTGQAIAFEHFDAFAGANEVRLVPAAGGATTLLASVTASSTAAQPAWSPDGRFVAFVQFVDGAAELFTVRADGSAPRRRTSAGAGRDVAGPAWAAR